MLEPRNPESACEIIFQEQPAIHIIWRTSIAKEEQRLTCGEICARVIHSQFMQKQLRLLQYYTGITVSFFARSLSLLTFIHSIML